MKAPQMIDKRLSRFPQGNLKRLRRDPDSAILSIRGIIQTRNIDEEKKHTRRKTEMRGISRKERPLITRIAHIGSIY